MISINSKAILTLAAVGLGAAWLARNQVTAGVKAVGEAVNPVSRENVFHKGVEAVGVAVSGDPNFSLGGWLYDLTHKKPAPEDGIGISQTDLKSRGKSNA